MATEYKWSISNLYTSFASEKYPNAVTLVTWSLKASNQNKIASVSGSVSFIIEEYEMFTPYEKLTENMVLDWVMQKLGQENIKQYKKQVDDQLNTNENVSVMRAQELPWSKP